MHFISAWVQLLTQSACVINKTPESVGSAWSGRPERMQPVDLGALHHILHRAKAGNRFLYAVCSTPSGRTWSASTSSSTSCGRSRTFQRTSCRGSQKPWTTTRTERSTSTMPSKYFEHYIFHTACSVKLFMPHTNSDTLQPQTIWHVTGILCDRPPPTLNLCGRKLYMVFPFFLLFFSKRKKKLFIHLFSPHLLWYPVVCTLLLFN